MKHISINNRYFNIVLVATIVCMFAGCEKDRNILPDNTDSNPIDSTDNNVPSDTIPVDTTKNNAKIYKIDITNAKMLFATSAFESSNRSPRKRGTSNEEDDENKDILYKVMEDETILEVISIDENGDTVSFRPKYVYSIPKTPFVFCAIVSYMDEYYQEFNRCYLVNKENGMVQDVSYIDLVTDNDTLDGARYIQTDDHDHIYILNRGGSGGQIYRLDASNPDNVIGVCLTPIETEVFDYIVNGEGVLYCTDCISGIEESCGAHIYTPDGRSYPFDVNTEEIPGYEDQCTVFVGLDGKLRVWDSYTIRVFNTDNNDFRIDTVWRYKQQEGAERYLSGGFACDVCAYTQGRVLCTTTYGEITIVDSEDTKEIAKKTYNVDPSIGWDQHYVEKIGYTNQYVYCAVSPSPPVEYRSSQYIYRVDASGRSLLSELYFYDPDYIIYTMIVQENEEIIFCGKRLSDKVDVLASIDANGNLHIMEENVKVNASTLNQL